MANLNAELLIVVSMRQEFLSFQSAFGVLSMVVLNSVFHFITELPDKTLDRPGGGVSQGADSMAFNLIGEFLKHVDFSEISISVLDTGKNIDHPAGALTARRALSATFVFVELAESENTVDDINRVIHDDDGSSAEAGAFFLEGIEVHEDILANSAGEHGHRGASGNNGLQVVPAADDPTAMAVDEFPEGDAHFLLNSTGVINVPGDTEEFSSVVILSTEGREPVTASAHNSRANRNSFDVGDSRGAAPEPGIGREGRLKSGLSSLAFETLN